MWIDDFQSKIQKKKQKHAAFNGYINVKPGEKWMNKMHPVHKLGPVPTRKALRKVFSFLFCSECALQANKHVAQQKAKDDKDKKKQLDRDAAEIARKKALDAKLARETAEQREKILFELVWWSQIVDVSR